jgi:nucleotide-binding universal stress UspA family protein
MSTILVPIDFSIPSHNAYRYALLLAKNLKFDLVLAHYYGPGINATEPLVVKDDGSLGEDYTERLRAFARPVGPNLDYPQVDLPADVTIHYESEVALANSATIINRAKQSDISLVVMATRSTKRFMGNWLGSTSTTVSEACTRPVFLIPEDAHFTPFNQVVVANNHQTEEPYPLWKLEGLADIFKGALHFVHIRNPDQAQPPRLELWRSMNDLASDLSEHQAPYPFKVVTVDAKDISKGLLEYAEQVDADLVVVINQRRSRWQSLLSNSLSQFIALRSTRPLLVLHMENMVTAA